MEIAISEMKRMQLFRVMRLARKSGRNIKQLMLFKWCMHAKSVTCLQRKFLPKMYGNLLMSCDRKSK